METDLSESQKCKYCKHFTGKCCNLESTGVTGGVRRCDVNSEDCCFNGLFEKLIEAEEKPEEEIIKAYNLIIEVLKEYIDINEDYYPILALWIIGTHQHSKFLTYPYLFLNAMRGSGKTRLMKIIKELSWQGDMLASLSEAVMFRTTGTLCIDEFENLGNKDKNALRELLNTAYKKGGKVKRMKKKKTIDGESQVVEEFSTFRPLVIANISGMEEVLGDRCLTLIIEKSNNSAITRKIENFDSNPKFIEIRSILAKKCMMCMYDGLKNMYMSWNAYVSYRHTYTYTHTHTTQIYTNIHLFEKIYDTKIDGRNLELILPLLLVAEKLGILESSIEIIKKIVQDKKEEEINDSKDVMVFQLISNLEQTWISVADLTNSMRFMLSDEKTNEWLNNEWMGRALKRLNLMKEKKRTAKGQTIIPDVEKAKKQLEMFK